MKKIILIFISFFLIKNCVSQVQQEWIVSQEGNSSRIVFDSTGYIVISGGYIIGDAHYTGVIKYNTSGVESWNISVNYGENYGLSIDGGHNIYVACFGARNQFQQHFEKSLIKYNQSGVQQWKLSDTILNPDVLVTMIGDYYGNSYMLMHRNLNFDVSKYNSSGVQVWRSSFNASGSSDNVPTDEKVDANGNVFVIGETVIGSNESFNLVKYNYNGVQQWVSQYTPPVPNSNNSSNEIGLDSAGDIYVSGTTRDSLLNQYNTTTLKFNSSGNKLWVCYYLTSCDNCPNILKVDKNGNAVVSDYNHIIKYNSAGTQQWVLNRPCSALNIDKYYNLYVVNSLDQQTYMLYKYNASGVNQWQISHSEGNVNSVVMRGIILDTLNNIYISGGYSAYNLPFTLTGKYNQLLGIDNAEQKFPDKYSLSQNYPNPFNPITKIKLEIPEVRGERLEVRLVVYDVLGKSIANLVNEKFSAGSYEVEFNGSNYPSGVYFYKLTAAEFTETKRMVLLK